MDNKAENGGGSGDAGKKPEICSQETFDKNKAGWRKVILEKKKSVKDLIATIETKHLLTEDQKTTIDSWSHENE